MGSMALAGCVADDAAQADTDGQPTRVSGIGNGSVVYTRDGVLLTDLGDIVPAVGTALYTGFNAFEPTIGVTSDGTIFMTAFGSGGGGGPIVRSTDQGATWELVTAEMPDGGNNPPNSNDPYVWVDQGTDRVFTNDLQLLICSWLNYSDDLGETWTTNPAGCGLPPGVHDHQTIGTAPPRTVTTVGYDNVLYYCVNRVADSVCSTSLNGGVTFGPLIPTFLGVEPSRGGGGNPLEGFCGGLHGHVKSAPDGTTYLPKGQCGVAMVSKTVDDGLSWTNHVINQVVGTQGHEVSIAVDAENNVYAFWMGLDGLPYLAISTDAAETWTDAILVSPPGVTATDFPAIAAGDEGKIAFTYVGSEVKDGYEGDQSKAKWNAYIGVITNALDADPVIQTVTANPKDDPISVGSCGRTRCAGAGDFIDITIDFDGRPWAAHGDGYVDGEQTGGVIGAGFAATLAEGPALRGDTAELPPLNSTAASA
jgi:hypothetical protein